MKKNSNHLHNNIYSRSKAMAAYIAVKISTRRPTTAAFLARGITEYTAATITDIDPFGIKTIPQVAYVQYEANIAAFLSATSQRRTLVSTELPCPVDFSSPEVLGLSFPYVFYVPRFSITEEQAEGLCNAIRRSGPETIVLKKGCNIRMTMANLEDCTRLATAAERSSGRVGEMSVHDVVTASKVLHLVSLYLRTQTYSAQEEVEVPAEEGSEEKRKEWKEGLFTGEVVSDFPVSLRNSEVEKTKAAFTSWSAARTDESWKDFERRINARGLEDTTVHISARDHVYRARPSPYPVTINLGTVGDVPAGPGIVFPYFERSIIPSRFALPRLFQQVGFIRTLGATEKEYLDTWRTFRVDLQSLSDTEFGCAMSHIMTGVKLSLESQNRMFVVVDEGQYMGFCLLGTKVCVDIAGTVHRSQPASAMSAALGRMRTHSSAMRELCTILSAADISGTETQEEVSTIPGSAGLYREISKRKIDKATMTRIHGFYRGLRFPEAYLQPTARHITEGLFALSNGVDHLPNHPRFVPDNRQVMADPLFCFLALFGPEAPSPINVKGKSYQIPPVKEKKHDKPADDAAEMLKRQEPINRFFVEEKKRFECGILTMKPILVAYEDWKTALKEKAVKMNPSERAKVHRNLVFTGPQTRVYEIALSLLASSKQKGKRKADDDDEGESKKRKPKESSTLEELLGLFGAPTPALPPREDPPTPKATSPPPAPPVPAPSTSGKTPARPSPAPAPPSPAPRDSGLTESQKLALAKERNPGYTVQKIHSDKSGNSFTLFWWELPSDTAGGAPTKVLSWDRYKEVAELKGISLGYGTDLEKKYRLAKTKTYRLDV